MTILYTTIANDQVSRGQGGAGGAGATGGLGGSGNPNGSKGANGSSGPSGKVGSASGGGIDTSILANLGSTIVATNTNEGQPSDVLGELDPNSSNNLFGTGGSGGLENNPSAGNFQGNIFNVANPGLAPLGAYGGPTQTMALLPGSPAIGAGGPIFPNLLTDQRGFQRPFGSISDIGAFQTQPGIVVNTAMDGVGSLPGDLDLRQALNLAEALGAATFSFDPTIFATHQTIRLTAGQLDLSDTSGLLTFDGPAAGLTIDAGGKSGVFLVEPGVTAALSGLTLTGGSALAGGGLENFGTITLTDCTISGNSASIFGGGLFNFGTVTLTDCTISGNSTSADGGGVFNDGTARRRSSTARSTATDNGGGGVFNDGSTATLTDCTISGNSTDFGGGVFSQGTVTLTDCTISGNSANLGGGGVYNLSGTGFKQGGVPSQMTIVDTIVAGNAASNGPDVSGPVDQDQGYNLIGDGDGASGFTAAGDQVGTAASPINPRLAPLGDYGSTTQTMALLGGSPAIGKGVAIAGITTDQRGFALDSPRPDIGAFQSTLVVNTTTDAGYGLLSPPGELSLRQAVGLADFLGGTQTITFDSTAFATTQTITLTGGPLELSDPGGLETITGPAAGVTIDAGGASRVFQVDSGVTATLAGLTLTGGSAGHGGGLVNLGTITLTDCTISGNSAADGGGVYNYLTATLTDCTVSGNSASHGLGGGLWSFGTTTLTDCTISGNSAYDGGGVSAYGPLTLTACTVSGNSAAYGGGVFLLSGADSRTTIVDTIVAGNSSKTSPDLSGTVDQDQGYNLIGDGDGASGFTAAGDQVGTAASPIDPLLAPLGDYGGPTQTMALRTGSPAIGKGVALPGITTDQRGFALDSPRPDIGAFQNDPLVVNTTSDGSGSLPGILSLQLAVKLANIVGAGTITFDPTVFAAHETISLTAGQLELSATGGLEEIDGPAAGLTIDAGGKSRVFKVDGGVTAALSGLTITGGSAGEGGGLANLGKTTLTDCTLSGNSASLGFGGGLGNEPARPR